MRGKKFGICHFFPHQAWEMTKGENEGKTLKNNLYKNFRKSWGKKMIFQKGGGGKIWKFWKIYTPEEFCGKPQVSE